eukprot:TRINITY_DN8358_c0_g1_i1.p1 TRINITY_DN8358_c0_g1~~TRINITY_DN8358_c0_g1_i1.p1  ORF type:complete len:221 (-),score=37.58 TRINITY_DN8358_c0_g1_i1:246-908(-)
MNADVWDSKLVRWLRNRDELDLIPWKEILLLRVSKNQADMGWNQNQVVKPEPLGRDDRHDEENPSLPLLPTKIFPVDKEKGKYTCQEVPFHISTWKDSIAHLKRHGKQRSWSLMLSQALDNRRKSEYTDTDDEWEGSTTTDEGRAEWQPWVIIQMEELLKEIKKRNDFKNKSRDVKPRVHRWRVTKPEHLPAIQQRDWNLKDRYGSLVVQRENHIFFLLW